MARNDSQTGKLFIRQTVPVDENNRTLPGVRTTISGTFFEGANPTARDRRTTRDAAKGRGVLSTDRVNTDAATGSVTKNPAADFLFRNDNQ